MAKKKQQNIIKVKAPKTGSTYFFLFAGSIMEGTLCNKHEKLSNLYGHTWYSLSRIDGGREVKYPVSIYNIANSYDELRNY